MTVTNEQLASFVNSDVNDARLTMMRTQAFAILSSEFNMQTMPEEIADFALIQTVGELWKRANSNGALVQYGPDGQQSFLASDVLAPVRPTLRKWRLLGAVG